MNHLIEEQLYEAVFAGQSLAEEAQNHLAGCQACQQQVAAIRRLLYELNIAAHSQPTPQQQDRYLQLGTHIHRQPSSWSRLVTHLQQMTLALDNRQRISLQGLRSGSAQSYRLLYSATSADVELLVETQGHSRRIEGEVLPLQPSSLRTPVLLELRASRGQANPFDRVIESTLQGRFQFDSVPLGYYSLMITPVEGPYLQIEGIDIT
jgi:hypothetical protein